MDHTPPPAPPAASPPSLDPVGDDLAAALQAAGTKGEGERALGLLRDAHRILTDPTSYHRPAEIAESCVRGAVEGLLSLGGKKRGLAAAARETLKAIDAYQPPAAVPVAAPTDPPPAEPGSADKPPAPVLQRLRAAVRSFLDHLFGPGETMPPTAPPTPGPSGPAAKPAKSAKPRRAYDPAAALKRLRDAAEALRSELATPGGYHQRRAAGIVKDRTGRAPGLAQKNALQAWSDLYSSTSGTLHGADAAIEVAADRYRTALTAISDVFLPLLARRDEVLALLCRTDPSAADAKALAAGSDPRALDYFFQHRPAAGWLDVLDAADLRHVLMPDPAADGLWPAFPYLDDLTATHPDKVRAWLQARTGEITMAGSLARAGLLRLAARPGIGLAEQVRILAAAQFKPGHRPDPAVAPLAAQWARSVPAAERDEAWIRTVERLLAATVDAVHDQDDARHDVLQQLADGVLDDATADEKLTALAQARLADHEAAALMTALAATAAHLASTGPHPAGSDRARLAALPRTVTAVLVDRDLKRTAPVLIAQVYADLDPGAVTRPGTALGPRLARTVLDIATHEAAAGTPWAERTAQITGRLATANPHLADRLLADHLTATTPATGEALDPAAAQWWEHALALTERLPADPDPQNARLTAHVASTCPPQHTARLHAALTAILGPAPTTQEHADHLAARAADPQLPWPAPWLRAWDWSPVLPQALLAPWADVLATLRTHQPDGPRDPRNTRHPFAWAPSEPLTVTADDLTAADMPAVLAAAARLAAAPDAHDAHDPRHAAQLRTAVDQAPEAWTGDVAQTARALAHPGLQAGYLAALAARAAALPDDVLTAAARAALDLNRTLPPAPADPATLLAADALFTLLTTAWRTGADLDPGTTADALAHLADLSAPLTDPTTPDHTDTSPFPTTPPARALQALLEHAAHHARTTTPPALPPTLRPLLDAVLAAHPADPRTAQALAPRLPLLHRHAPDLLEQHRTHLLTLDPDRTVQAAAALWLRWGNPYPPLLAALDRGQLLTALRDQAPPESATHLAHALLADPAALGDPDALLTDLTTDADPTAVTGALTLLLRAAARLTGDDPAVQARVTNLWRTALDAGLPEGALAAAGAFADTPLDHDTWLTLTLASTRHTPRLDHPDLIAERAASHPHNPDALLLVAHLVAHPAGAWEDHHVRAEARRLLAAADTTTTTTITGAQTVLALREALVNAGDLDA